MVETSKAGDGQPAIEPVDILAAKKIAWQAKLEAEPFRFDETEADVLFSLSQYSGDCKLHTIRDSKHWLILKFERDGKDILTLDLQGCNVFRVANNVLYIAELSMMTCGCTVVAYDLTTGQKRWETKLGAVGMVSHSVYLNQVTMSLSSLPELDHDDEGVVSITGSEGYGDYVEILDRRTGKVLAHKIYREGYK
jgi:hypothetical protein